MSHIRFIIACLGGILLAALAPCSASFAEAGKEWKQGVLILPLHLDPKTPSEAVFLGMGAQSVLEHTMLADGTLEQTELFAEAERLFPKEEDFREWFAGNTKLPAGVHETKARFVVTGHIQFAPTGPVAHLEVLDQSSGKVVQGDTPVDFPTLVEFRSGFMNVLKLAGIAIPSGHSEKMMWKENLSAETISLLGRGLYDDLVTTAYHSDHPTYDTSALDKALQVSPGSYALLDELGWVTYREKKYPEARAVFEDALKANPAGVDALDGMAWCAVKTGKDTEEEYWTKQKGLAQGRGLNSSLAELWKRRGLQASVANDFDKATECFSRAAEFNVGEPDVPALLQFAFVKADRLEEGEKRFNALLQVHPEMPAHKELQKALAAIERQWAENLEKQHKLGESLVRRQKTLELDRVANPKVVGSDWLEIARIYRNLEQPDQAVLGFNEARSAARENSDEESEATSLLGLALLCRDRRDYQKEIQYVNMGLALKIKDATRASLLGGLGFANLSLKLYTESLDDFENALKLSRQGKDRKSEASDLQGVSLASYFLKNYKKAAENAEQAASLHHELNNPDDEFMDLFVLGQSQRRLGEYKKAIQSFETAESLNADAKNREQEGIILDNIGWCYSHIESYDKGIPSLEASLTIAQEVKGQENELEVLEDLGSLYWSLGYYSPSAYEKAAKYLEDALALSRKLQDADAEITILQNLVWLNVNTKQNAKAAEYEGQALSLARRKNRSTDEMIAIGGLAAVEMNMGLAGHNSKGEYQQAAQYAQQALAIARKLKNRKNEGSLLGYLALIYTLLKDYPKVAQYSQQSLVIARETGDRDDEQSQLANLMYAMTAMQQRGLAIIYGKQSVNILEEIREQRRDLKPELQETYLRRHEDTYRKLAELLGEEKRFAEAQRVLLLLKNEEDSNFTRGRTRAASSVESETPVRENFIPLSSGEAGVLRRYFDLIPGLAAAANEIEELEVKSPRTTVEQQKLSELHHHLEQAQLAVPKMFAETMREYADSKEVTSRLQELEHQWSGFQNTLADLGPGAVVLYTVVTPDKYLVYLVSPTTVIPGEYGIPRTELRAKVCEFLEALRHPTNDPLPMATDLYNIVFKPVEKALQELHARTLMWSLDDVLRYIPISALNDGRKYLIENYENVVMTGNSVFNLKDPPTVNWQAMGFGLSERRENLQPLGCAQDELVGIIRDSSGGLIRGVLDGEIKLNKEFTIDAMDRALSSKRYPVVHLATHFILGDNEDNSYLLLGGYVNGEPERLTWTTIRGTPGGLFHNVELLTLSACETAKAALPASCRNWGGITENIGSEIDSFATSAQGAGAKAVLATLWPVNDISTSLLMRRFYAARAKHPGVSKAEALQEAQLALLHDEVEQEREQVSMACAESEDVFRPKDYTHPFFWAPFILIGNGR
jgi:CHAT domain-containing protein